MKTHWLRTHIGNHNNENSNHKITISDFRLIFGFDDAARGVFDSIHEAKTERMIENYEGVEEKMKQHGWSPEKPVRG